MPSATCARCGFDNGDNDDAYVAPCCDLLPSKADRTYVGEPICAGCHEELLAMGGEEPPADVAAAYNRGDRAPFHAWLASIEEA